MMLLPLHSRIPVTSNPVLSIYIAANVMRTTIARVICQVGGLTWAVGVWVNRTYRQAFVISFTGD